MKEEQPMSFFKRLFTNDKRQAPSHETQSRRETAVAPPLIAQTVKPSAEAQNKLAQLKITYDEDAFITCSKEGKTDAVKLFLEAGMNPDAKTYDGKTALMGATRGGHVEIVQALLANGAEVNAKDNEGMTPLFKVQKIEVAQALLDKGADVNANNNYNWTPLMYAAQDGHNAVIQLLLTKGAKISAKDGQGRTALMKAAERGHVDSVKALLAGGADLNMQTITGETAHAMAAKGGHTDVVAVFESEPSYKSDARKEPKAELIAMIEKLTENWMTRGGTKILDGAAKEVAGSNNFGMDVVKELVLDSFFSRLPMDCRVSDIGSVSMRVGAAMDGPTFARWLGENIVVGREPSQMRSDLKYGRFGMWQEAKELCQKLGIRFT
jgi:ankyrin repeat protein